MIPGTPRYATSVNPAALQALFETPDGPVLRELGRRGLNVQNQAKLNATGIQVVGARNPMGRGPRVRTGRLRSSISLVLGVDSRGPYAAVGTNVYYGRYLELGLRGGRTYPFLKPALSAAYI